jgi:hypothetical protein
VLHRFGLGLEGVGAAFCEIKYSAI